MRSAILFVALLVFIPCAGGQTASLAINSAALNIDPTSTDSYTLQGAFTSLDFTSAQSVTLQVGPFSSTLPIAAFTSPSSGVLNYQDSTGQSPYWISSLTIDTNASTFTSQATGVVLSGIENPFTVQLGTDTAYGCSMARVQQTDVGVYQLNPGDGANEPCQIAEVTTITPTIPVSVSTNVLFQLNVFEGPISILRHCRFSGSTATRSPPVRHSAPYPITATARMAAP